MGSNKRHRRCGSMYVMVLGSTMIVTVIGLSAMMLTRIERRFAEGTADFTQARLYARSAIEMGLHRIRNDANWRTSNPNGIWLIDQPIGIGTYTLEGVDPNDGDLTNHDTDPLVLTGVGMEGDARYKLGVTLVAETPGLTCLEAALHANDKLGFGDCTLRCNQIISCNDTVTSSNSTINSDVEAVTAINGGTYNGTTTSPIPPRMMPDATVFDYYLTNGTPIDLAQIGKTQNKYIIENVVISPSSNPYNTLATNPEGIYVINCAEVNIVIRNSRIVGTLVILDPGPQTEIQQSVNWAAAVANYPALLVRGTMQVNLDSSGASLSEGTLATNFNPPGTPYNGVEDGDTTDTYPSLISGLVYTSLDLNTEAGMFVEGVVVVGNMLNASAGTNINLTYQRTFLDNPPPGFTEPPRMVISPGTWGRVVD